MLGVSWIASLLMHYNIEIKKVNICLYYVAILKSSTSCGLIPLNSPHSVPQLPHTVHDTLLHPPSPRLPRPHHRPAPSKSTHPNLRFILQLPVPSHRPQLLQTPRYPLSHRSRSSPKLPLGDGGPTTCFFLLPKGNWGSRGTWGES